MTFKTVKWPTGDGGSILQYFSIDKFPKAEECVVLTFKEENKESLNSLRDQVIKRVRNFEDTELKNGVHNFGKLGFEVGAVLGVGSGAYSVLSQLNGVANKNYHLSSFSDNFSKANPLLTAFEIVRILTACTGASALGGYFLGKGAEKLEYIMKKRKYEKAVNRMLCKPSTDFFRPAIDDELVDLRDAIEGGKELRNPRTTYERKGYMQYMLDMGILTPEAESVYKRKLNALNRGFYEGIGLVTRN